MMESIGSTFSTSSGFEMANFNLQILLNVQLCVAGFRLKLEHFRKFYGSSETRFYFSIILAYTLVGQRTLEV